MEWRAGLPKKSTAVGLRQTLYLWSFFENTNEITFRNSKIREDLGMRPVMMEKSN